MHVHLRQFLLTSPGILKYSSTNTVERKHFFSHPALLYALDETQTTKLDQYIIEALQFDELR